MPPFFHSWTRPVAATLAGFRSEWFYFALAIVMAVWVVGKSIKNEGAFPSESYDRMVASRFLTPEPDQDIVILNIDEKSLTQMSAEFGRWPWPRDVLASVLTDLEQQGAKAIVFDILFSDADTINPASDKVFADSITASTRSFFPVLRLNPANDSQSKLLASEMHGLAYPDKDPVKNQTFALVPPYFASAIKTGRLGTHNLSPDKDNIVRRYSLWEDTGGWRVVSIPQRLAMELHWPTQQRSTQLLQWMAKPMPYKSISFSDYYSDTQKKARTRPLNEFNGKIVLIGATAASLFDIKATPIASVHPGIDVLATAIDNTKNDRFIRVLPQWLTGTISLLVLALMVWLSIRYSHEQMAFAFVMAPTILMSISYLCLNLFDTFINLSAIASVGFLYFAVIKIHSSLVRSYWSGIYARHPQGPINEDTHILCLTFVLPLKHPTAAFEPRLYNIMRTVAPTANVILNLEHSFGWLHTVFQRTVMVTWMTNPEHQINMPEARRQAAKVAALLTSTFMPNGVGDTRIVESKVGPEMDHVGSARIRSAVLEALAR